jgi:NAD(P)-dependent dehydrogenase (short-subunit alcohol dehydrogenase family)
MSGVNDNSGLRGRRVVVTGGARGIGYAIARAAAASGAVVALLDLEQATLDEAAAKLGQEVPGTRVFTETCDISSYDQVSSARAALLSRWGGEADTLVNNAGIVRNTPAEEMSVRDWDEVLKVNLSGYFYCSQVFGVPMIKAGKGSIVSIASMSGLIVNRPQPQVAYNVSKAGVIMMTKSLAAEWAPYGVRVNAVAPGYIRTSITESFLATDKGRDYWGTWIGGTPLGRMGTPAEIAAAVLFLASDEASFITGEILVADGGYTLW